MGVAAADLTKLYLAYFGRPPAFDGLQFYTSPTLPEMLALGSSSIPLSKMLPREIELPAYAAGTRRRRHGLSPAQRVIERQRLRRVA
jgi:hypothetical protein